jgi:hypothetical protein
MPVGDAGLSDAEGGYTAAETLPVEQSLRYATELGGAWTATTRAVTGAAAGVLGNPPTWLSQIGMNMGDPSMGGVGGAANLTGDTSYLNPAPSQTLPTDVAQQRFGVPGYLKFDHPVTEDEARIRSTLARYKQFHDEVLSRSDPNMLMDLGSTIVGGVTDPGNVMLAASGVGEGLAGLAGLGERVATEGAGEAVLNSGKVWNGIQGAARAGAATAVEYSPYVAKDYALSQLSGDNDFDMGSELANVAGFAVLHSALHFGASRLAGYARSRLAAQVPPILMGEGEPAEAPAAPPGEAGAPVPGEPPPPPGGPQPGAGGPPERGPPPQPTNVQDVLQDWLERLRSGTPEPEAPPGPDFRAMGREIDPDAYDKADQIDARTEAARTELQRLLAEDRDARPDVIQARTDLGSVLGLEADEKLSPEALEERVAAVAASAPEAMLPKLSLAYDRLMSRLQDDTPQIAQVRQTILQLDRARADVGSRIAEATRQAQAQYELPPTPGGPAKPDAVERLNFQEATGAWGLALDQARNDGYVDVAGHINDANKARDAAAEAMGMTPAPEIDNPDRFATASTRAMSDAGQIKAEELDGLIDGDPAARAAYLTRVAPDETEDMLGENGEPTKLGQRRIDAAIVARAYGDADLVRAILQPSAGLKGIGGALKRAAPEWARLVGAIERGEVPAAYNMTDALVSAGTLVNDARASGQVLGKILFEPPSYWGETPIEALRREAGELQGMMDRYWQGEPMLSGDVIGQTTEALLRMFFRNESFTQPRSSSEIEAALRDLTERAFQRAGEEAPGAPEANVDLGTAILRDVGRRYAEGWDAQSGIQRAPGWSPGAEREAESAGAGVREHGGEGGPAVAAGVPEEGAGGAAAEGGGAPGDGGKPADERAGEPGDGGREPGAAGDTGRNAPAVGEATAKAAINGDRDLTENQQELETVAAERGEPIEYPEGRDPGTLAEACKAAGACFKGELG